MVHTPDKSAASFAPALIVFERHGRWAAALRIEIEGLGLPLVETRSLEECEHQLREFPGALVAVAVHLSNVGDMLTTVDRWSQRFPTARRLVCAERGMGDLAPFFREAGAVHCVESLRGVFGLRRMFARYLKSDDAKGSRSLEGGNNATVDEILAKLNLAEPPAR